MFLQITALTPGIQTENGVDVGENLFYNLPLGFMKPPRGHIKTECVYASLKYKYIYQITNSNKLRLLRLMGIQRASDLKHLTTCNHFLCLAIIT